MSILSSLIITGTAFGFAYWIRRQLEAGITFPKPAKKQKAVKVAKIINKERDWRTGQFVETGTPAYY